MEKNKPGLRLGVLISGGGTTLQNLIDRAGAGRLPAHIAVVISTRREAYGLVRAKKHGIPHHVVSPKKYLGQQFHDKITALLSRYRVELVILAGFLSFYKIPPKYEGRVMNIHPALIPSFCGKGFYGHKVHEAVLSYGVKVSGCTVHFADNRYDHGPIIIQRVVPVADDDTPETLAARVFEQECEAYPEAIRLFTEGRLKIEGRRVRVLPERE